MTTAGFPHSDTLGSTPGCRLPEDYRRLQRPSSAPGAKTSTVCSYKLDTACTTCKLLQKQTPKKGSPFAEDARVHCAVLKIRTEQGPSRCIRTGQAQAVRVSAHRKRLLPQDPTVCSPSEAIPRSFHPPPRRGRTGRAVTRRLSE